MRCSCCVTLLCYVLSSMLATEIQREGEALLILPNPYTFTMTGLATFTTCWIYGHSLDPDLLRLIASEGDFKLAMMWGGLLLLSEWYNTWVLQELPQRASYPLAIWFLVVTGFLRVAVLVCNCVLDASDHSRRTKIIASSLIVIAWSTLYFDLRFGKRKSALSDQVVCSWFFCTPVRNLMLHQLTQLLMIASKALFRFVAGNCFMYLRPDFTYNQQQRKKVQAATRRSLASMRSISAASFASPEGAARGTAADSTATAAAAALPRVDDVVDVVPSLSVVTCGTLKSN